MNSNHPEPGAPIDACEAEDHALHALHEIYREVGLSDEDARKSALADYEHVFGLPTACAA